MKKNHQPSDRRFLFQCNEDVPVARKLKAAFPDSVVTEKNPLIHSGSFTAVVCLSKNISHIAYNGIRNQCRAKGIPYIHVSSTNVNAIKAEMERVLGKGERQCA